MGWKSSKEREAWLFALRIQFKARKASFGVNGPLSCPFTPSKAPRHSGHIYIWHKFILSIFRALILSYFFTSQPQIFPRFTLIRKVVLRTLGLAYHPKTSHLLQGTLDFPTLIIKHLCDHCARQLFITFPPLCPVQNKFKPTSLSFACLLLMFVSGGKRWWANSSNTSACFHAWHLKAWCHVAHSTL